MARPRGAAAATVLLAFVSVTAVRLSVVGAAINFDYGDNEMLPPFTYDVVVDGPRIGLQLDPDTLEVIAFDREALGGTSRPGTSGMVSRRDKLVAVNGEPLAYLKPAEARKILADAPMPRVLTFMPAGQGRSIEDFMHAHPTLVGDVSGTALFGLASDAAAYREGAHLEVADPMAMAGEDASAVCGEHANTAYDFAITLNGAEAIGLVITKDLFVVGFQDPPEGSGSGHPQVWEGSSALRVGDRIIGVGNQCLMHLPSRCAMSLIKEAFTPAKTEEVVCRGETVSTYCSVKRLPRKYEPRRVVIRPGHGRALSDEERGGDHTSWDGAWASQPESASDSGTESPGEGSGDEGDSEPQQPPPRATSGTFATDSGVMILTEQLADETEASPFEFASALFGGQLPCRPLRVVAAEPISGCGALENEADLLGAAVLVQRGGCFFTNKARNVQEAGGAVVIVYNTGASDSLVRMPSAGDDAAGLRIAAVMVPLSAGTTLLRAMKRYESRAGLVADLRVTFDAPGVCLPPSAQSGEAPGGEPAEGGAAQSQGGMGTMSDDDRRELEEQRESAKGANALLSALLAKKHEERSNTPRAEVRGDAPGQGAAGEQESTEL